MYYSKQISCKKMFLCLDVAQITAFIFLVRVYFKFIELKSQNATMGIYDRLGMYSVDSKRVEIQKEKKTTFQERKMSTKSPACEIEWTANYL